MGLKNKAGTGSAPAASLNLAFGCPTAGNTVRIPFNAEWTVSGVLAEPNSYYRLMATEDCFISVQGGQSTFDLTKSGANTGVPVPFIANWPEIIRTTDDKTVVNVVQATTSGLLYATRLIFEDE